MPRPTLRSLNRVSWQRQRRERADLGHPHGWPSVHAQRQAWEEFKAARYAQPTLYDEVWGGEVLTQPAAIKAATDWARANDVVSFFDAGDVQANGFQIVEDERLGPHVHRDGRELHGLCRLGAAGDGPRQQAVLRRWPSAATDRSP